jgi:succinoglycan biosynthesis transport protein ExoP
VDHSDGTMFNGPAGPGKSPGSEDPIARNPQDVSRPEDAVQPAQVSRRSEHAITAAGTGIPGTGGGLGHSVQPAPSMTELLLSVLRFKWTLLIVFILVSGPIIAAIWTQTVPQYQARAEVRVRPIIPRLVFKTEDNGAIPFYESFVNTQVSLIRSLTVLQRVLDREEVQKTQWYKGPTASFLQRLKGDTTPPMERLRDALSVRPRVRTEIIDVSFTDASAKDAKVIVDAVLQQYLKYVGESANATEDVLYNKLVDQYKSLDTEIQGREKVCADLQRSLGTDMPQQLIAQKRVRLDEMEGQLRNLEGRIAILTWEKGGLAKADGNETSASSTPSAEKPPRYHVDAEWRKLEIEVKTAQHQIDNSRLAPSHPDRVRLEKNLEFARSLLKQRETQLDDLWADRMAEIAGAGVAAGDANNAGQRQGVLSLEHQLARARQEESLLRAEWTKLQAEFQSQFDTAQLLEKENQTVRAKRELFDEIRRRLEQKNIERNVPGSIEVLTWAFSPSKPTEDRRVVFSVMALFAGLGMGGAVAFLRAKRNQAIYTFRDMPQPLQAPFLGHIPYARTSKLLGEAWCDETGADQYMTESIRLTRTTLLSCLNGRRGITVLISSAMPGTGKSSVTLLLGRSIAQTGKKVLLIDADFYKRTLSTWLQVNGRVGFIDALSTKTVESQHLFTTKTSGLHVMPAGKQGDAPVVVEEIANGAFKACMGQLLNRYKYDIILLDSPPMLPVADAVILANQVDGTVLVEREHVSQRGNVANALIRLNSTGGRLLGTVFVGSDSHASQGYGYGYGGYGGYGYRKPTDPGPKTPPKKSV